MFTTDNLELDGLTYDYLNDPQVAARVAIADKLFSVLVDLNRDDVHGVAALAVEQLMTPYAMTKASMTEVLRTIVGSLPAALKLVENVMGSYEAPSKHLEAIAEWNLSRTRRQVVVISDPRTSAFEAHGAGCRDLKTKARHGWEGTNDPAIEARTTREVWVEVNYDFLVEGGADAAWPIKFHPCCELVEDDDRTWSN